MASWSCESYESESSCYCYLGKKGGVGIITNIKIFIVGHLDWNILRWFFVGCVTVSIDWFIFVNLYPHIGSVAITNFVSGSFSTAFNYISHHRWTFKSDQRHLQSGVRYGGALFGGYLLNTILVKVFIVVGTTPGVAKLLAAAIQAPASFLVLKFFVFKGKKEIHDGDWNLELLLSKRLLILVDDNGCHVITATNDISKKLELVGMT